MKTQFDRLEEAKTVRSAAPQAGINPTSAAIIREALDLEGQRPRLTQISNSAVSQSQKAKSIFATSRAPYERSFLPESVPKSGNPTRTKMLSEVPAAFSLSADMIVSPKIRGFICTTAHPTGCAKHVADQIAVVKKRGPLANGPKKVLVIGSSTGYGLASRIAAAFGANAATIGVFFERGAEGGRTATAGWYNSAAFEREAAAAGLYARSFNGDAFSDAMKQEVIAAIKADLGQVDCVIYSLASPRRTHPKTGEVFKSVLKPIGESYTNKNLNTGNGEVNSISIEPANEEEIAHTTAVMGGEDWEMWMDDLLAAGVLAPGVRTLAYSYIGPVLTWPIYKNGTIGRAKQDLERCCSSLNSKLAPLGGKAWVSVNKALVTQASSAIPVVPLYISLLYKIMKAGGTHEECIEQMDRLFRDRLSNAEPATDIEGRIRLDDWEMTDAVQNVISERWDAVDTSNFAELADFAGYQESFLRLFGFGLPGVDYQAEVEPEVSIPSLA